MSEFKRLLKGFMSRKLLINLGVMASAYFLPISFKNNGISDSVMLASLALIGSASAIYSVANVKDKPSA